MSLAVPTNVASIEGNKKKIFAGKCFIITIVHHAKKVCTSDLPTGSTASNKLGQKS